MNNEFRLIKRNFDFYFSNSFCLPGFSVHKILCHCCPITIATVVLKVLSLSVTRGYCSECFLKKQENKTNLNNTNVKSIFFCMYLLQVLCTKNQPINSFRLKGSPIAGNNVTTATKNLFASGTGGWYQSIFLYQVAQCWKGCFMLLLSIKRIDVTQRLLQTFSLSAILTDRLVKNLS